MKDNKILLLFIKLNIWIFFIFINLIIFTSCENYNKLSSAELNTILEQNKNSNLFMSFYAHMPKKVEESLIERELKNGTLHMKYINGTGLLSYSLNYDNSKVADFYLYNYPTNVELFTEDGGVDFSKASQQIKLERILNIYEKKYHIVYSNSYKKWGAINMDSIVLRNNSNVVIVTGEFIYTYNYPLSRMESLSYIHLKHYTNETFQEMLNTLRQESLNQEIFEKNKLEEITRQNNKTLNDLH